MRRITNDTDGLDMPGLERFRGALAARVTVPEDGATQAAMMHLVRNHWKDLSPRWVDLTTPAR